MLVHFSSHSLYSLFLSRLTLKCNGIGISFVHLSYPIRTGWQFFDFHGIILPWYHAGVITDMVEF